MSAIEGIIDRAYAIIDGIAFEIINNEGTNKILAYDLYDLSQKASFALRDGNLILSVSSFKTREQALMDAVRINNRLLLDEVLYA